LHKKNDRKNVSDYRPITLLNCEYNFFTKALSLALAETAPSVIYRDQAGFVPGRSIIDQVKLTKAIIALDQEKAYEKIKHEYL
jgi:hypothetical protein